MKTQLQMEMYYVREYTPTYKILKNNQLDLYRSRWLFLRIYSWSVFSITYSPLFFYKLERIIRENSWCMVPRNQSEWTNLWTTDGESIYESANTPNVYLQYVGIFYYRSRVNHSWKSCFANFFLLGGGAHAPHAPSKSATIHLMKSH